MVRESKWRDVAGKKMMVHFSISMPESTPMIKRITDDPEENRALDQLTDIEADVLKGEKDAARTKLETLKQLLNGMTHRRAAGAVPSNTFKDMFRRVAIIDAELNPRSPLDEERF
jgi:hypothetical protein